MRFMQRLTQRITRRFRRYYFNPELNRYSTTDLETAMDQLNIPMSISGGHPDILKATIYPGYAEVERELSKDRPRWLAPKVGIYWYAIDWELTKPKAQSAA